MISEEEAMQETLSWHILANALATRAREEIKEARRGNNESNL